MKENGRAEQTSVEKKNMDIIWYYTTKKKKQDLFTTYGFVHSGL